MNLLNALHKLDKIIERFATIIAVFSFIATLFMMVFISADVGGRVFFSSSINGCYEVVEVAMATCVFASLAYTQVKHGHVHVTMVITHFPPKLRSVFYALTSLLTTCVIAMIGYASATQCILSANSNQVTGVLKFPYAAFYGIESFCMWVFFLVLAYDTAKNILSIFYDPLAEEIQSTWS